MSLGGFGKGSGPKTPPKEQIPFGNFPRPHSPAPPLYGNPGADSLHRGNNQNLHIGDFGGRMQKSVPPYVPPDTLTRISPKVSHFQDFERTRTPVQYTDDFLAEPSNVGMETPTLYSHQRSAPAMPGSRSPGLLNERSISPTKTSDTWQRKGFSPKDETQRSSYVPQDAFRRPSLSPPKSRSGTGVLGMPDFQPNPRLSPSVDRINDDISVRKFVSQSAPKRNRSPPVAGAGQISQTSFFSTEDDTERELQAKAKRLARFKVEPDKVEPDDSLQYGLNVANKGSSLKVDQSAIEKQKFSGELSSPMEETSQDNDKEDVQSCSVIVGLCPDMCPVSERGSRERKGDLDRYERLDGDRNQTSKALAVKKYTRTAEREAELIRPMPILGKTMDYLLGLLDQPYDDRFLGLYNFLWDRMRAIRMDLRMQHIFNLEAITMLEQMIRLHIIAMHELCEFSKGEGFSEGFDAHLNIEQMNKTSVELFQLYDDHRKRGIFISTEKEFRGYYALLKLDKHPGYKVEPAELSLDLAKMTVEMRQTQEILFARDVARSCRTGNFIAFFRHARRASYLQACLMHAHFSKLRTQALAALHSGLQYNQGLPATHLAKWLGMEGEDIESLLEYHGFSMKEFEEPFMVKEGPFINDEKDYPTRCSLLVHGKKSDHIVEDISSSHLALLVPSESKKERQLEKDDKDKYAVVQPLQTNSPSVFSGVMEIDTLWSPRNRRQAKELFETSRIGQVHVENSRSTSVSSPKHNIVVPKVFPSFQSHSRQELPSPASPKDSHVIMSDAELSHKSPLWNISTPQFVPDKHPAYVEPAREAFYDGVVSSHENSLEIVVASNLRAMEAEIMYDNVNKFVPPAGEIDFGYARSSHEDILMEEVSRKKLADVQQNVENNDVVNYYDEEVALAKLKLFIRLWRRRSARKKEWRELNRSAANAALDSLSLGPPVHHNQNKHTPCRKLNIDQALSKRSVKHQQSWSRWNVSEVVAAKLGEKNAKSNCICWKVILFSWLHRGHDNGVRNPVADISLDQWLQYKLIPSQKDETICDLVASAPGMEIWSKWVRNDFGGGTCCLSVIKDADSGSFEKNLLGASAILFAVSEIVPWELQRVQLHNLVMSLPPGACVPLLILSGSSEDNVAEFSSIIVDKLRLNDIDNSRVGSFLVKSVNERDDTGSFDGYFSDQKLKDGFMWLASETFSQPDLYRVTMRELVSSHLNICLDALDAMEYDKLGPNSCISVFNEALDRSVNNIVSAANVNPTGWPCPELYLLDNSIPESKAVMQFLPSLGWSSSQEVEPLISSLRNLRLPSFSDNMDWLNRNCSSGKDIEDQIQLLQDCLIKYLTQSSNVMNLTMATKETVVMLQQCTKLELLDTEYKVVPSWQLIFRRVFSWQLNKLGNITHKAYILEQAQSTYSSAFLEKSEFEAYGPRYITHPSLDEMIEVSCSPVVSSIVRSVPKTLQNVSEVVSISDTNNYSAKTGNQCPMVQVEPVSSDVFMEMNAVQLGPYTEKEADRLGKLFDRCNILQDEIEKKLSIYF